MKRVIGYSNYGGGGAFGPMSAPPLSEETPPARLGASPVSKKRYYVEPLDNCGTLDPPPPRDRTWSVMDRGPNRDYDPPHCFADYEKRADARTEADRLNAADTVKP